MDRIVSALDRLKESRPSSQSNKVQGIAVAAHHPSPTIEKIEIPPRHLEAMRIVAHDVNDPRSTPFDILRTQLLQTMQANNWRVLAISSPTAGAGKTFTALNLAASVARIPETSVLLIDMDLRKPQIGARLGLKPKAGLRSVLDGQQSLHQAIVQVSINGRNLYVLPTERGSPRSSDKMKSAEMANMLRQLKNNTTFQLVILDLPPVLAGDDVISILPYVDCVLLVAAAGSTTKAELKECSKYLGSTPIARIVLNKLTENNSPAYY